MVRQYAQALIYCRHDHLLAPNDKLLRIRGVRLHQFGTNEGSDRQTNQMINLIFPKLLLRRFFSTDSISFTLKEIKSKFKEDVIMILPLRRWKLLRRELSWTTALRQLNAITRRNRWNHPRWFKGHENRLLKRGGINGKKRKRFHQSLESKTKIELIKKGRKK